MKKPISLGKIVLFNFTLTIIHFLLHIAAADILFLFLTTFINLLNLYFIFFPKYKRARFNKAGWLFIGRRKSFLFLYIAGAAIFISLFLSGSMHTSLFFTACTTFSLLLYFLLHFDTQITSFLYKALNAGSRVAIIGSSGVSKQLGTYLSQQHKFSFQGYLDENDYILTNKQNLPAGSVEQCIEFARSNNIRELYISSHRWVDADIDLLIQKADKHCIRLKLISDQSQTIHSPFYYIESLNDFFLLKKYNEPLTSLKNRIAKRLFDILVSGFVILFFLSWLVPIIALLIKIESKGPVFFRQLRSGRNNRSFLCYKFRTMVENDESDHKQATRDDKRITRVGKFLRKTSLDEFPQFFNVMKNEMSIAGPRPHMLSHTREYSDIIEEYMVRLYLKPGVTGWAQVNGYRGETINISAMRSRIEHDIWYMENWSLWLDVKIFYMTIKNIFSGEENAC